MFKKTVILCVIASLLSVAPSAATLWAKGGSETSKPVTIRWAGYITKMQPVAGGVVVTLGTSYYATGVALVNKDTKIRVNGVSQKFATADVRLGDFAEVDVYPATRIAFKLESIGPR